MDNLIPFKETPMERREHWNHFRKEIDKLSTDIVMDSTKSMSALHTTLLSAKISNFPSAWWKYEANRTLIRTWYAVGVKLQAGEVARQCY